MENNSNKKKSILLVGFITQFLSIVCVSFFSRNIITNIFGNESVIGYFGFIFYYLIIWNLFLFLFIIIYLLLFNKFNNLLTQIFENLFLSLCSIILIFSIIDTKLFSILGNHCYDSFVIDSIFNKGFNKEAHLSFSTIITLTLVVILCFLLPFLIKIITKNNKFKNQFLYLINIGLLLFSVFFLYFNFQILTPLEKALPFFEETGIITSREIIIKDKKQNINLFTNYSKVINDTSIHLSQRKNILFIVVESFRGDMISKEFTPNLIQLFDTLSTIKSKYHFSGSHITERAVFSLLYGINSAHYNLFCQHKKNTLLIEYLKSNNYKIKAYSAMPLSNWNGSGFMVNTFDNYFEFANKIPYQNEYILLDSIKNFNVRLNPKTPFCCFAFINATHHNYYYPPSFEYYKPVMEENYNHFLGDEKLEASKEKIFNRYKNSLKFVDDIIGKIVENFKFQINNQELIVIVTGDHAEEFWDKGLLGHGATNLYNCRTQVPLILHLPNQPIVYKDFTSHLDIVPTLFDYLCEKNYNKISEYFDGKSLLETTSNQDDYSLITSCNFDGKGKLCLINKHGKYWLTMDQSSEIVKLKKMFKIDDAELSNILVDSLLYYQLGKVKNSLTKYQ